MSSCQGWGGKGERQRREEVVVGERLKGGCKKLFGKTKMIFILIVTLVT